MKIFGLVLVVCFYLESCQGQTHTKSVGPSLESRYSWAELTKSAEFPKAYNFQIFSIRDTLWAFHPAGTWYSVSGKDWMKSPLPNAVKQHAFLDYVWFKNAIYALGTFEGNSENFKFTSAVRKTSDLKKWVLLASESNLPKRFFYHPFVFKGKLWIIGGNPGTNNFDGSNNFSDIWNSTDGVHWVKQADNLPFGKREHSQFVVFKDKIFMLNNDVWSSINGLTWTKEVDRLARENIFGYASVVYDDQIWLLGCNRDGVFQSQVLVSKDGKKWSTMDAPWTPRGAATACVFQGKIIMTGGKYGGLTADGKNTEFVYSNDVWSLQAFK